MQKNHVAGEAKETAVTSKGMDSALLSKNASTTYDTNQIVAGVRSARKKRAIEVTGDMHSIQSFDVDSSLMSQHSKLSGGATITRKPRTSSFLKQPKATIFSSVVNLCNTVIGAAILAIPEGMSVNGWLLYTFLFIFFCTLEGFTLHLLMMCAQSLKIHKNNLRVSFLNMSEATVPKLKYIVDFTVGIGCLGACCAYLVVIGDFMPVATSGLTGIQPHGDLTAMEEILLSRKFWITVFVIFFIIPTARLKKLDALRFTSLAGMFCFAYTIAVIASYTFMDHFDLCEDDGSERYQQYCTDREMHAAPIHNGTDVLLFFKSIPRIIFAFCCHQNAFSAANELNVPSKKNLNKVVVLTEAVCFTVYMIVSFSGYYSFGALIPSNILNAFPKAPAIFIARLVIALALAFSYPVLSHPTRKCFSSLIFGVGDPIELSWVKYHGVTWSIVAFTYMVSMITDDLGIVLDLVGCCECVMSWVLPGLFYYYLPDKLFKYHYGHQYKKYFGLGMTVCGCIIVPASLVLVFVEP